MISDLSARFHDTLPALKRGSYNETEVRVQFINPLFEALGWDMDNRLGRAEVKHEDKIAIAGKAKAPDYGFYLDNRRRFFVEAKKPAVDLSRQADPAFQLRRYAWTAKLPLSVLTDFEEFAVYDTRVRPKQGDAPAVARLRYWRYDQYADQWHDIAALFGRDAVLAGSLEQFAINEGGKKGIATVDADFLGQLNAWRDLLAHAVVARNPTLSGRDLNFAVQQTLDRLIFLRIAEDRAIEPYGRLRDLTTGPGTFDQLLRYFYEADNKYNSGLFHFRHERHNDSPDLVTPGLTLDDKPLKEIIRALYEPISPYEFSVFPADILGQVYEQFLGNVIQLETTSAANRPLARPRIAIEQKPEVRKAGGVYYTPTYIVEYIVRQTVGRLVEGHAPDPIGPVSRLRVLDPACGSGSFLLGAYQFLLDWHLAGYRQDVKKWSRKRGGTLITTAAGDTALTLAERKRILLDNLYGVDIDPQAVEVTKLSLLLKVLEGAAAQVGPQATLLGERVLPDLDNNIKCGNSLIGPEIYDRPPTTDRRPPKDDRRPTTADDRPTTALLPPSAVARQSSSGQPSAVGGQRSAVGRQPSLLPTLADDDLLRVNAFDWAAEFPGVMKAGGFDAVIGNPPYVRQELLSGQKGYLADHYDVFAGTADLYTYFIERGIKLLRPNGYFGYIVANKWMRSNYGRSLRSWLKKWDIVRIVDFGDLPVFQGATTYPCILIVRNHSSSGELTATQINSLDFSSLDEYIAQNSIRVSRDTLSDDGWALIDSSRSTLLAKLAGSGIPLGDYVNNRIFRGVLTGLNEAFVIDRATRDSLIEADPRSADIIKPFLAGRDIKRYIPPASDKYLIFARRGININDYPAIKHHLMTFKTALEPKPSNYVGTNWPGRKPGTYKWYEIQDSIDYFEEFSKPKLLVPDIALRANFTYDENNGYFCVNTAYIVPTSDLYLLGILNSKLISFYYSNISPAYRGGYLRFIFQYLVQLPILAIDPTNPKDVEQHDHLVSLVQQMLDLHRRAAAEANPQLKTMLQRQIAATDGQIDRVVYGLYGLTEEEVGVVENK